jgi:hypothetical protein
MTRGGCARNRARRRLMRGSEKETGPENRTCPARGYGRDASPLIPHRNPNRNETPRLNQRCATSTVAALSIPIFCGKCLQLCSIFWTIIVIAIMAPTIRITSCDDLTTDLTLTRIVSSWCTCQPANVPPPARTQNLGRGDEVLAPLVKCEFYPSIRRISLHSSQFLQFEIIS